MNKKRKYVLTGGPCCGKTTLINELRQRGFSVLEEIARQILEQRKHIPPTQEEWEKRQCIMLKQQIKQELTATGITFLDRGVCDIIAYSKHLLGYVPNIVKNSQLSNRYDSIFILNLLPFEHDGLRIESGEQEATQIHNKIISVYQEYGYRIINVPAFPEPKEKAIKQRADYILEIIKSL